MGTKQTRRSISVKGATYARLKTLVDHLQKKGPARADGKPWSCSNVVEDLISEVCDREGVGAWTGPLPTYPKRSKPDPDAPGQHFTF